MALRAYTIKFPKYCNQETLLKMIVLMLYTTGANVNAYPGNFTVTDAEILAFNAAHPDFIQEYMNLLQFCQLISADNQVMLENISVISASGTAIISVTLTPKTLFTVV